MRDIVQHDTADCIGFQYLLSCREVAPFEVVVLSLVDQRDKGIEPSRPVLKIAQTYHMVDTVRTCLHMPKEHRCVTLFSSLMPFLMDLQPLF